MDFNEIRSCLERLSRLADGWMHDGISTLERDIALDELRKIYSVLRFASEDEFAATSGIAAEQTAASDIDKCVADSDYRVSAAENETGVPDECVATDNVLAESVLQVADEAISVSAVEIAATDSAAVDPQEMQEFQSTIANTEPIASTEEQQNSDDHHSARNIGSVQSLFGEDELPAGHRRRLIMMSLYDDEPIDVVQEKGDKSTSSITVSDEPQMPDTEHSVSSEPPISGNNESTAECNIAQKADIVEDDPSAGNPAFGATDAGDGKVQLSENERNIDNKTSHEFEHVLGEVINNDLRTVADTIQPARNIAETAGREHVDDLNKAIGVNDRFLLIRDLFGGRAADYETAVHKLNSFDNLDDCMVYIVENFEWNPNADGTKLLMELIERKYNR